LQDPAGNHSESILIASASLALAVCIGSGKQFGCGLLPKTVSRTQDQREGCFVNRTTIAGNTLPSDAVENPDIPSAIADQIAIFCHVKGQPAK
jgi:hypothetical protein